ncbi:MAG: 50S ribosomal protein L23 [Cyclobacteriaceae bacterium]|nr:50S ribosomal protein L23 [Cyclobacteriaceae bacterium]
MTVLKKPLVTEKISALNEKGKYGFIVEKTANKIEIKKAVEKMYGVKVESVATLRYQGKDKSRYTKAKVVAGRTSSFKKAIVTLAQGEVIDFYGSI